MKHVQMIALLGSTLLSGQALAHEEKGANGGRLVDAGGYHVELVVSGNRADVYISDGAGKPLPPRGFKGTAFLMADGKPLRIALEPVNQKLSGNSDVPLPPDAKGAVRLTTPDGKIAQGQFK